MLRSRPIATYILIVVCTVITIAIHFVSFGNTTENAIVFGAFYRPFLLAGEWWRLFTVGLVHIEWTHLLMNMVAFFTLGNVLEIVLGWKKYLILLFMSTIGGSLFSLLLSDATVAVGLSAGLYGLMGCFAWFLYQNAALLQDPKVKRELVETISLNLIMNFLPGVGWQAHLGGFLFGFLLSMLIFTSKKSLKILTLVALTSFTIFLTIVPKKIDKEKIYLATDIKILDWYNDIGLQSYTNQHAKKLDDLYEIDTILEEYVNGEE